MTELSELFADVAPDIQRAIRDLGWHTPTPVQAAAIPKMRAGGDLIVQAMTGSGKTGAFGIPLVENIDTSLAETQAIVLLPTRELANQVAVELDQLGQYRGVRTLPIYGGVAYGPQLEGLEKGAHIVVGTPGRILDHLKNNRMDLSHTKVLVLDEADEMLSLGFWPDMKEVASFLPRKRQSHLFSATMPEKVRSLSRFFLTDAEDVTIEAENGAPQKIEHYFYMCTASEKEAVLARILKYEDPDSAIIFCNTKADVRYITGYLSKRGLNIDQISGDLPQAAREKAIKKIKSGQLRYLVATDVAARGIDISDLAYVINYTTSDSPEVYVHRTGRTGRAGKSGVAISLVSGLDIGNFKFMQTVSKISVKEKKVPTERDIERRAKKREAKAQEAQVEALWNTAKARAEEVIENASDADVDGQIERLLPFVREAAQSDTGIGELTRICAALLIRKPVSEDVGARKKKSPRAASKASAESTSESTSQSSSEPSVEPASKMASEPAAAASDESEAASDPDAPENRPPQRRRRTGRGNGPRGGGASRSSGSASRSGGDRPSGGGSSDRPRRRRSRTGGN